MTDTPAAGAPGLLAQGQALLASQEYSRAIAIFDEILRSTPSDFMAVFERARGLQGLGNWEAAGAGYSEALRLDATVPTSYVNRGFCRGNLGDHAGAAEDFERFLDVQPQRADIWAELGDRRLDAGAFARAAEAYERAAALDSSRGPTLAPFIERSRKLETCRSSGALKDFAAACRDRGWERLKLGAVKTSAVWFSRAIDAVPDDADAWHGRAMARGRLGQIAEAVADLEKSVALSPESAAAWTELGSFRSIQGNQTTALEAADQAARRNPGLARAHLIRGVVLGRMEKFAEAEAAYSRSLDLDPQDDLAWSNRGWVRRKSGRFQEAIDDFTEAIRRDATQPLSFSNRGYAHRSLGNHAAAGDDFKKAMALDPSLTAELSPLTEPSPAPRPVESGCDALTESGSDKLTKGDLDGAIADLSKALDLDPKAFRARYNRGLARWNKEDLDGALLDFSLAVDLNPKHVNAVRSRGMLRQKRGDYAGAVADYVKTLELDPQQKDIAESLARLRRDAGLFCDACVKESTAGSPGNMSSINGCGMTFYGRERNCPTCGSVVQTQWFTLLHLPLLPVATYRVMHTDFKRELTGTRHSFTTREMPLCWPQVLKTWLIGLIVVAAFVGGITAIVISAENSRKAP